MPLGELIRKVRQGDLNELKGNKIVTYCSGGYRGNIAADELNKQGFDAVTIEGGYSAWKDEEKKKEEKSSSNSNE
jgi:rhodanese-related sulfurtransferase